MPMHPVKIIVLDCLEPSKLYDPVPINTETGKPHVKCPIHHKGQVFTARSTGTPPEGFCPTAWHDIKEYIAVLMHGGGELLSMAQRKRDDTMLHRWTATRNLQTRAPIP